MVNFRVLIIEYVPNTQCVGDMKLMINKAKTLKQDLVNGPLVIFGDQIDIEKNYKKEYVVVEINNIPDDYIKKVFKRCKKIGPYSIRTSWTRRKD